MASITLPRFPAFPSVDFSTLDLTALAAKLPTFTTPKMSLPTVNLPEIQMPQINVPRLDLPAAESVTSVLKDAGYITVGLAVLTLQKAQVRRQELKKSLTDQVGDSRSQMAELVEGVEAGVAAIDQRLIAFEAKVDAAVIELEKRLPERAGELLGQVHEVAKVTRQQVRNLVSPA